MLVLRSLLTDSPPGKISRWKKFFVFFRNFVYILPCPKINKMVESEFFYLSIFVAFRLRIKFGI